MIILIIIIALLTDCLFSALVGIVGSRRRIGFGWSFIISVIFTPLVGLVVTLISEPLQYGERKWGCLVPIIFTFLSLLGLVLLYSLFSLGTTF